MKRLAILETGRPPEALQGRFGDYPAMFQLGLGGDRFETMTYDATNGHLPDADAYDCALITGSASGVYEGHVWIGDLIGWLKKADADKPIAGICFGHQIMAQAYGGHVEKSPKGWGVGVHSYALYDPKSWPGDSLCDTSLHIAASHQDQVVKKPSTAIVLAGSDFTEFGAFTYTDRKALTLQTHPEFDEAFIRDLWLSRRGTRIPEALVDDAMMSLETKTSNRLSVLADIANFLGA